MTAVLRNLALGTEPVAIAIGGGPGGAARQPPARPVAMAAVPAVAAQTVDESRQAVALVAALAAREAELRAQWQAERETALQAARAQGHAEGLAAGRAAARDEARAQAQADRAALAERMATLDRLLAGLQAAGAQLGPLHEDALVALVHEAVCRILGSAAPTPSGVAGLVGALLREGRHPLPLALHLTPQDAAWLAAQRTALGLAEGPAGVSIVADPQITLGGCRIESAAGQIDALLDTQLQQLRLLLLAARSLASSDVDAEDLA